MLITGERVQLFKSTSKLGDNHHCSHQERERRDHDLGSGTLNWIWTVTRVRLEANFLSGSTHKLGNLKERGASPGGLKKMQRASSSYIKCLLRIKANDYKAWKCESKHIMRNQPQPRNQEKWKSKTHRWVPLKYQVVGGVGYWKEISNGFLLSLFLADNVHYAGR